VLLPAGNLREPFSALKRATILVLRGEDSDLERSVRQQGIVAPIWWIDRVVEVPPNLKRTLAFCGIGRPEEFFASLRENGIEIAATFAFPDHHRYTDADVRRLIQAEPGSFVTTEKDYVRLSPEQRAMLSAAAPLQSSRLIVQLRNKTAVTKQFLALLTAVRNRPV
jgi:tetraacyldisaccharide 4'-kinase